MNGKSTPADGDGAKHKSIWGPLLRFVLSLELSQTQKLVLLQLVSRAAPAVPGKQTARCRVSPKRRELAKAAGVTTSTASHALKALEDAGLIQRRWGQYDGGHSFRVYELVDKVGDALKFGATDPPRKSFDRAAAGTPEESDAKEECAAGSTVGVLPAAPTPCSQQQGGGVPHSKPEVPLKVHQEDRKEVSQDACARAGAPHAPADGNGNGQGKPTSELVEEQRQRQLREQEEQKTKTKAEFEERKAKAKADYDLLAQMLKTGKAVHLAGASGKYRVRLDKGNRVIATNSDGKSFHITADHIRASRMRIEEVPADAAPKTKTKRPKRKPRAA